MLKITDIRCEQQKNAPQAVTCKGTKKNTHLYCKGEREKKQWKKQ